MQYRSLLAVLGVPRTSNQILDMPGSRLGKYNISCEDRKQNAILLAVGVVSVYGDIYRRYL